VDRKEAEIAALEQTMFDSGNATDSAKLMELTKKRDKLQQEVSTLMEEWDELEVFLASMS